MKPLLAFPVFIRRPDFGMQTGSTEALDWFVIATLCFFFFLLGCFATVAWQIWRRTTRPPPHVQLLMELDDSDDEQILSREGDAPPKEPNPKPPWEKNPEWWKQ